MALDPAIAWSWALSIFTAYNTMDGRGGFLCSLGGLRTTAALCCALLCVGFVCASLLRDALVSRVVLVRAGRRTDDYPLRYLIALSPDRRAVHVEFSTPRGHPMPQISSPDRRSSWRRPTDEGS